MHDPLDEFVEVATYRANVDSPVSKDVGNGSRLDWVANLELSGINQCP